MYFDEILDHFKCGKKIRRASWPIGIMIDRNNDRGLNIKDLLAEDWEVVEEKKNWWKPELDETYWSVHPWRGAVRVCYNDHKVDGFAVSMGLCFQTEEQAEFMVEKLKVIHELEKFAFENNTEEIDWYDINQAKYHLVGVFGDKGNNYIKICSTFMLKELPFNIYFISEEIARKAIETIGEDRIKKYYFGVNENGRE